MTSQAQHPSRVQTRWIAAFSVLAALATRDARAGVIQVPAEQPTVRAAVAVAGSGDTILVAPGIHAGGVWINGKSLTIASRYIVTGDTTLVAQTVLDGVAADACAGAAGCVGNAVLEFGDNAHGSAVIGLTITEGENGVASASIVDITRCRVIANGDGVDYVAGSGGTIRNSLFADNSDDGIDLNGRMDMRILDNEIRDNRDDGIEFRLHAFSGGPRQVDIVGNRITGNGEVGIQFIDYPPPGNYVLRIERNLFRSNFDAAGLSAAISCMPDGETIESLVGAPMAKRMVVIHNTFIGEKNGLVGGANAIVLNNIFTGIQGAAVRRVGGNSITSYSLFWGNGTDYTESNAEPGHLLGASPLLDPAGVPLPGSPAINAGTAHFQWQGETVLDLAPTAYTGGAPDLGAFETAYNAAPQVSAGPDRIVVLAADVLEVGQPGILTVPTRPTMVGTAALDGTVGDDGLPVPPALAVLWSVVSGPGPVAIANPRTTDTHVTFYTPGAYVLRLEASDGLLAASDLVEVVVRPPINRIPVVHAGPPQTVWLPDPASLAGTVLDDGLPDPPGALAVAWSLSTGPGPVTFEHPYRPATRAGFTTIGTYVLRLTADDGEVAVSDSVVVTVAPVRNRPPVVDAGPDQIVMIPSDAVLEGTVSDDGLPDPPASVTLAWSAVAGPGPVTFADSTLAGTRAAFTVPGAYRLRLAGNDGLATVADTVEVTVVPPPPAFERRVSAGSDDAEERENGNMVKKTAGLDLVYDGGNQIVGVRFTAVDVPAGAVILAAHVQFKSHAAHSGPTPLVIHGQAADHPPTFTFADRDVSSRPRTASAATWSPPPWTVIGEAGPAQRTSDLAAIVQEIVDRPGWAAGNAMAFIITGTGRRVARTFEADSAGAALLHVEYGGLPQGAAAGPVAAGTASSQVVEPDPASAGETSSPSHSAPADTGATLAPVAGPRDLAIHGLSPQPSRGLLRVEFTAPGEGPAELELVDIAGRRVTHRALAPAAGRQAIELRQRLPAGVYLVRLAQGPRAVTRKAVVLE